MSLLTGQFHGPAVIDDAVVALDVGVHHVAAVQEVETRHHVTAEGEPAGKAEGNFQQHNQKECQRTSTKVHLRCNSIPRPLDPLEMCASVHRGYLAAAG